jgi:hypothetical protein
MSGPVDRTAAPAGSRFNRGDAGHLPRMERPKPRKEPFPERLRTRRRSRLQERRPPTIRPTQRDNRRHDWGGRGGRGSSSSQGGGERKGTAPWTEGRGNVPPPLPGGPRALARKGQGLPEVRSLPVLDSDAWHRGSKQPPGQDTQADVVFHDLPSPGAWPSYTKKSAPDWVRRVEHNRSEAWAAWIGVISSLLSRFLLVLVVGPLMRIGLRVLANIPSPVPPTLDGLLPLYSSINIYAGAVVALQGSTSAVLQALGASSSRAGDFTLRGVLWEGLALDLPSYLVGGHRPSPPDPELPPRQGS